MNERVHIQGIHFVNKYYVLDGMQPARSFAKEDTAPKLVSRSLCEVNGAALAVVTSPLRAYPPMGSGSMPTLAVVVLDRAKSPLTSLLGQNRAVHLDGRQTFQSFHNWPSLVSFLRASSMVRWLSVAMLLQWRWRHRLKVNLTSTSLFRRSSGTCLDITAGFAYTPTLVCVRGSASADFAKMLNDLCAIRSTLHSTALLRAERAGVLALQYIQLIANAAAGMLPPARRTGCASSMVFAGQRRLRGAVANLLQARRCSSRTWLGSKLSELQAEPVEAQMPCISDQQDGLAFQTREADVHVLGRPRNLRYLCVQAGFQVFLRDAGR